MESETWAYHKGILNYIFLFHLYDTEYQDKYLLYKIFRFDKSESNYCDLPEEAKEEEKHNILNGFNFSKKVLETGESDVIILDELLGLIDLGIITEDDVEDLIRIQGDYKKLIITGNKLPEQIRAYVDEISEISWDGFWK